jgi:hypothetical protein
MMATFGDAADRAPLHLDAAITLPAMAPGEQAPSRPGITCTGSRSSCPAPPGLVPAPPRRRPYDEIDRGHRD